VLRRAGGSIHRNPLNRNEEETAMTTTRTMRGWVFGVATASALGFGGTQVFAAPAPAARGERVCDDEVCNQICLATFNNGGRCGSRGICVCLR
jgi:hypothetical protein